MSKVPAVYEYGDPASVRMLIQPVNDHDLAGIETEAKTIMELAGGDFRLIAVKIEDWNRDLSPWEAAPVFGKEAFGGGAAETLAELLKLCDTVRIEKQIRPIYNFKSSDRFTSKKKKCQEISK